VARRGIRQGLARLKRRVVYRLWPLLGLPIRLKTRDRRELERRIIPHLSARPDLERVLFVGCSPYTKHYERFFRGKEYWTIDVLPEKAAFGSTRHLTDSLRNLRRHFPPGSLDLVICNGVLGHGLNEREEIEEAFAACHACLRAGGLLLLGWNDVAESRPCPPDEIESLRRFQPSSFPPFGTARYATATENRHTFDFYVKAPPAERGRAGHF
jgi:SAM-dependent methyltransferase